MYIYISFVGSCDGYGYRSDGAYTQSYMGGLCGSGNPYYLMCQQCRQRYLAERDAKIIKCSVTSEDDLPYARLLQLAPDLLGSADLSMERSEKFF